MSIEISREHFVELNDFMFRDRFLDISDLQFNQALQIVNAEFSGVYSLWSVLPPKESFAKRKLCINYLLAWKLMQTYPDQVVSGAGMGGMPIDSKKAGPISLKYRNMVRQEDSLLAMLTTNQYGIEALTMIQSAPEMYELYK